MHRRARVYLLGILLVLFPSRQMQGAFEPIAILAPAVYHAFTVAETVIKQGLPFISAAVWTGYVARVEIKYAYNRIRNWFMPQHAAKAPVNMQPPTGQHALSQPSTAKIQQNTIPPTILEQVQNISVTDLSKKLVQQNIERFTAKTLDEKCTSLATLLHTEKECVGALVVLEKDISTLESCIAGLEKKMADIQNSWIIRWWYALKEMELPSTILKDLQTFVDQLKTKHTLYIEQQAVHRQNLAVTDATLHEIKALLKEILQIPDEQLQQYSLADLQALGCELKIAGESYRQVISDKCSKEPQVRDVMMVQKEIEGIGCHFEQAYQKTVTICEQKLHTPNYYAALQAEQKTLQEEPPSTVNQARIAAIEATCNGRGQLTHISIQSPNEQALLTSYGIPYAELVDPYQKQLFDEQRASAHAIDHLVTQAYGAPNIAKPEVLLHDALTHLSESQLMQFIEQQKGISGKAFVEALQQAVTTAQQTKQKMFQTVGQTARKALGQSAELSKNGAVVESRKCMDYVHQAVSALEHIVGINSHITHIIDYLDMFDKVFHVAVNEAVESACQSFYAYQRQFKIELRKAVENSINIPQVVENICRGTAQFAIMAARASVLHDRIDQLTKQSMLAHAGLCSIEPVQERMHELETELHVIADQAAIVGNALIAKWSQMSGPERAGFVLRLVVETYLTGKVIGFVCEFSALSSQLLKLKMAELIREAKMLDALPFQELAVEGMPAMPALFETASNLKPLATEAHLAADAVKAAGAAEAKVGAEVVKGAEKIPTDAAGKIQNTCPAGVAVGQKAIITSFVTFAEKEIPALKEKMIKLFENITLPDGTKIRDVALEHIFGLDVTEIQKASGKIKIDWSGLHHDYMGELEGQGIITLQNKVVCPKTGVIKTDVIYKGNLVPKKTFFPSAWTREKVIEKVMEALKNPKSTIELGKDGKWAFKGITSEGLTIGFYITQKGAIKTFFPVFE